VGVWAAALPACGQPVAPPPVVIIETNLGEIRIELDPEGAPITVDNFLKYVRAGFYDGTIFHRVIDNFMVQGGAYTRDLKQKTPLFPAIPLEARNGLRNRRGAVAMARSRAPDSATSQFFINLVDNPFLDYNPTTNPAGYAVFGHVVSGWETLDQIRQVKVVSNPTDLQPDGSPANSLPVSPVTVRSIRLAEGGTPSSERRGR
jgi:cyclophilin family peptidyl-prolyl cis-trans isomerase